MDKNKLIIKQYTIDEADEYKSFIKNSSIPIDLMYLKKQNFLSSPEKNIFLLLDSGIFNKSKIIGYCIIYNYIERDNPNYCKIVFNIPDDIVNFKRLNIIADFMIHPRYRQKKLGTYLYNEIVERYYKNNFFILYADGDGKYFWPKLGFELLQKERIIMIKECTSRSSSYRYNTKEL